MEELIEELKAKADLSQEQAQKSVSTMVEFIKTKLPAGLSDKVEDMISGNFNLGSLFGGGSNDMSSAFDMLSNMFGGGNDDEE